MHANARSADSILTVAWIAPDFPLEWLADVPEAIQQLPRQHPATWQQVLLSEFENDQSLRIHVIVLRKNLQQNLSFTRNGVVFHVLATLGGLRAASLFWVDTIPILRVVRRIQPDLVHAWGTERGAALIAARLGYPFLATIQGLLSWYAELVPLGPYNRFIAFLERISLRRSLRITTESRFAAEYLKAKYPRLAVQQVEHAPNWLFHRIERRPQIQPARLISVGFQEKPAAGRSGQGIGLGCLPHSAYPRGHQPECGERIRRRGRTGRGQRDWRDSRLRVSRGKRLAVSRQRSGRMYEGHPRGLPAPAVRPRLCGSHIVGKKS